MKLRIQDVAAEVRRFEPVLETADGWLTESATNVVVVLEGPVPKQWLDSTQSRTHFVFEDVHTFLQGFALVREAPSEGVILLKVTLGPVDA